jgi:hypothetical protein
MTSMTIYGDRVSKHAGHGRAGLGRWDKAAVPASETLLEGARA